MNATKTGTLAGQVAVVTGGGRGIGRAIAQALGAAGASVVVVSRSRGELAETVETVPGSRFQLLDVTNAADVIRVFTGIGRVDILVNNAGYGGPVGPVAQANADDWWRTLDVNLRGPLLCTQAVLPGMIARGKGHIVNVSSAAGNMVVPHFSSYVTSKAALNKMTECLAAEVKEQGVAVFVISPGPVRTAMSESMLNSEEGKKWLPWFEKLFETQSLPAELAADLCVKLADGKYDRLTGRFLSVREDLDALT